MWNPIKLDLYSGSFHGSSDRYGNRYAEEIHLCYVCWESTTSFIISTDNTETWGKIWLIYPKLFCTMTEIFETIL